MLGIKFKTLKVRGTGYAVERDGEMIKGGIVTYEWKMRGGRDVRAWYYVLESGEVEEARHETRLYAAEAMTAALGVPSLIF